MRDTINPTVLNQNSGSSIEQSNTKSLNTAKKALNNLNMTMPLGIKLNALDTSVTIEAPSTTKKQRDLSLIEPAHSRLSELTKGSNIPNIIQVVNPSNDKGAAPDVIA